MLVDVLKWMAIVALVVFGVTLFDSGLNFQLQPPQPIQISRTLEQYGLPTLEQMGNRLPQSFNSFFVDFKETAPQALKSGGTETVGYAGVGGVALAIMGTLVFVIGWITLIGASFMTNFLWGMASLTLPGFGYVFALTHLDGEVTRKGVIVSALGVFLGFSGALLTVVAI